MGFRIKVSWSWVVPGVGLNNFLICSIPNLENDFLNGPMAYLRFAV